MARPTNKARETPMDIVAGNVAGLIQRHHMNLADVGQVLGYAGDRTMQTRLKDPASFTGSDLNHICQLFGVTLEQLAHDGFEN